MEGSGSATTKEYKLRHETPTPKTFSKNNTKPPPFNGQ